MSKDQKSEKNMDNLLVSRWKIIIPVFIGLLITGWMIYRAVSTVEFYENEKGKGEYTWIDANQNKIVDFSDEKDFKKASNGNYSKRSFADSWQSLEISLWMISCLFMAFLMMGIRDLAYMIRIRILTDKQLSWKQSFRVIMIWEFASAMTPGVVGGAAVAMFILKREGINLGRSTAIVLITALLDELFYVLIVPIILLIAGTHVLFPNEIVTSFLGFTFDPLSLFFIAFAFILLIVLFLLFAIFITPNWFKSVLLFFCRIFFLKRLRERASKTGDDVIIASKELRGKPFQFWMQAFGATVLSWTGRFLVINFIILAFAPMADMLLVFARQLSMWVLLLISPTPGGSGIAEFAFSGFLGDFIPFGLVAVLAILWRLISYYPYLVMGAWILPQWLSNKKS